ncbi:MAG: hypothetical protein V3T72_19525, partial [Thermoanaerobaculia bacterium]
MRRPFRFSILISVAIAIGIALLAFSSTSGSSGTSVSAQATDTFDDLSIDLDPASQFGGVGNAALTIGPIETCQEIVLNGVIDADEDFAFGPLEGLDFDVVLGLAPPAAGGSGGVSGPNGMVSYGLDVTYPSAILNVRGPGGSGAVDGASLSTFVSGNNAAAQFNTSEAVQGVDGSHNFGALDTDVVAFETGPGTMSRASFLGITPGFAPVGLAFVGLLDGVTAGVMNQTGSLNGATVAVSLDANNNGDFSDPGDEENRCPTNVDLVKADLQLTPIYTQKCSAISSFPVSPDGSADPPLVQ